MQLAMIQVVILVLLIYSIHAQDSFTYNVPGSCASASMIYDDSLLSCISCPSNAIANHNQTSCICAAGYYQTSAPGITPISCTDCISQGMVASQDRSRCLTCDGSTQAVLDQQRRECTCSSHLYALSDTTSTGRPLSSKQCSLCPSNSYSTSASPHDCIPCPDPNMVLDSSTLTCRCATGYTQYLQTCISNSWQSEISANWPVSLAAVRQYRDIVNSDGGPVSSPIKQASAVISSLFMNAATGCKYLADITSCQALLNLCVLQLYDPDSPACNLFASIAAGVQLTQHEFRDWKYHMPMAMLSDSSILTSTSLMSNVALAGSGSELQYVIVSYYVNGTIASVQSLTNELQLCPQSSAHITDFTLFGSRYDNACWISLTSLLTITDPLFYDLYYVDNGKLFPVPIKILNYRESNQLVNIDPSTNAELMTSIVKLHRRFLMVDTLSGRVSQPSDAPTILSYVKTAELRVSMQYGSSSKIYPPLLVLTYSERETSALVGASASSWVLFRGQYSKDLSGVWTGGNAVFVCAMLFIGAVLLLQIWKIYINSDPSTDSAKILITAMVEAVCISSDVIFWMVLLFTSYFLVFFKFQQIAFVLLPLVDGPEERAFTASVIFVFLCKIVVITRQLWRQINVDLFFIDWEKPKQASSDTYSNVSVWRKLFVANEWNELATIRTVNIELILLALLFLLRGINLEYLSTSQPSLSLAPALAPINILLRFAVTSTFILSLSIVQVVYRKLIHHRFFTHDIMQFVDFMNMSNISAFVLDSGIHGYYIHGRTLHAFADASMEEITRQLRMERKDMVKNRGLVNGKDTFEIFVTPDFRLHYGSIFREIAHHRFTHPTNGRMGSQKQEPGDILTESSLLAQADAKLNRFLRNFIDQNSTSYVWAEAQRTFLERVFDIPPAIRNSKSTLFYDDPEYRFTSLYLMGIEYDIVTFLISLYAVCDLAFDNTFVSIFVVFVANRAIGFIRQHWGQINISKKTLVDERFLL